MLLCYFFRDLPDSLFKAGIPMGDMYITLLKLCHCQIFANSFDLKGKERKFNVALLFQSSTFFSFSRIPYTGKVLYGLSWDVHHN